MNYVNYVYSESKFVIAENYTFETFSDNVEPVSADQITFNTLIDDTRRQDLQLNGLIKRVYVPEDEIVKYLDKDKGLRSYNPISDTPELYLELNKIEIFNEKSLLRFIDNYGLPFDEYTVKGDDDPTTSIHFPTTDNERFILGMDTLWFYERLYHFQSVLKMWDDIVRGNFQAMINMKNEFEKATELPNKLSEQRKMHLHDKNSLWKIAKIYSHISECGFSGDKLGELLKEFENDPYAIDMLDNISSEEISAWKSIEGEASIDVFAKAYLNLLLKDIESGDPTTALINGKIVPSMRFNNLLEVAGYQLRQAIFKNEKLKECLNCGALFEPRHARQKFCSPLPGRKRSTCENTYNQRKKRIKNKKGKK